MGLTELSKRGVTAQLADSALDVYTRTLFESSLLAEFHKSRAGSVRSLNSGTIITMLPWEEIQPWSILTASEGFNAVETDVSGVAEGLRLKAWFVWPESSFFKALGDPSSSTLDEDYRITIEGGRDIGGVAHPGNPTLTWRDAWTDADLPAGWLPGIEPEVTAAHGILEGPGATNYMQAELPIMEIGPCMTAVLECSTTFGVVRANC